MAVWIPKKDLLALGVGEATIYRKDRDKVWESRRAEREGPTGQPPKEYLLETLPADLQIAWLKLDADRRTTDTDQGLVDPEPGLSPDSRLQEYMAALTRFSPPQYSLEQREAVERR